MRAVSTDDEGKHVLNQDGETIGMVTAVEKDRLFVDPDPDLADRIRSKLGWDDADEEDYVVEEHDIEVVTDDSIRLDR